MGCLNIYTLKDVSFGSDRPFKNFRNIDLPPGDKPIWCTVILPSIWKKA